MNEKIEREMQILHADINEYGVDEKLAASDRLNAACGKHDLPQLVELIKSSKNDFWVRELLSQPICELGGTEYLVELFEALNMNSKEGHDNDIFCHHLIEVTCVDPIGCRIKLNELLASGLCG